MHTVVRHNFVLDRRQDERDKQDDLAYNDDDGDRNDTVLKFGTFSYDGNTKARYAPRNEPRTQCEGNEPINDARRPRGTALARRKQEANHRRSNGNVDRRSERKQREDPRVHARDERGVRGRCNRNRTCICYERAAHGGDERSRGTDEAEGRGEDGVESVAEEDLRAVVLIMVN